MLRQTNCQRMLYSARAGTLGPQSEVAEAIQHLPGSQHSRSEDSETNGTTTAPAQESLVDQLTAVGPSFQAPDSYQQHSISSHGRSEYILGCDHDFNCKLTTRPPRVVLDKPSTPTNATAIQGLFGILGMLEHTT